MVDKQIKQAFRKIRATVNQEERYILKADTKADKERDQLKKKLRKY